MAKVFCITLLIVKNDIQVYATLTLVSFGNLELHARLSLGIFLYPLFYQRTGETRTLDGAYAVVCAVHMITFCPGAVQTKAQNQCYCPCYSFHLFICLFVIISFNRYNVFSTMQRYGDS